VSRLRQAVARLRAQVSRRRLDEEFREEVLEHFELAVDDGIRRGLTPERARAEARLALGGLTQVVEARREGRRLPLVETMWQDLRFALRQIRARPQFAFTAIAVLALGIGSVTTVFAVVDALVRRPLPYPAADRLVRVDAIDPSKGTWPLPQPDVIDIQRRATTLTLGGWRTATLAVETADGPQQVPSAAVTASFFPLLGRPASQGRTFSADDDRPGGARVAVVTRRFWEQRLGADPHVVGRTIGVAGHPVTIVGVLATRVDLLPGVEVFTPLAADPEGSRSAREVEAIARLAPGTSMAAAEGELARVMQQLARENPASHTGWTIRLSPLRAWVVGPKLTRLAWVLFAAVVALCLLACANVACLLLARGSGRRQEFAMRRALGASQARIVGQLLMESLCLATLGAAGGVVVAAVLVDALRAWAAPLVPQLAGVELNAATLGFVALVTASASVVAGLAPAREAGRSALHSALRTGRTIAPALTGRRLLVVAQVGLATLLAVGATLLGASFLRMNTVDVGFDQDRALAIALVFPDAQYDAARRVARLQEIAERLEALPGVRAAGATSVTPFQGFGTANQFRIDGSPEGEYSSAAWRAVTPGFFHALGLPLVEGRLLDARDGDGAEEVVVITRNMARRYWPNQNPVGRRLLWGRRASPKTIVGVVGDFRDFRPDADPAPTMFRPHAQLSMPTMTLIVRTEGPTDAVWPDVRRTIRQLAPDVPFEHAAVTDMFADSLSRPRVGAAALTAFALIALLLAASGVYGLLSYVVAERGRELAVRLALGARPRQLLWSITRQSAVLVGLGGAIGVAASWVAERWLESVLYRTSASEAGVVAAVVGLLTLVGVATALGPALRAMRTDPARVLSTE
jgi:predicted permease